MDQLSTILLTIAHVLAASAVSIHVLLNHKEVRSSFGWIGLAWLSPFIGSSIYMAFGINWVARRTSRSRASMAERTLPKLVRAEEVLGTQVQSQIISIAKAVDTISGLALTKGNSFHIYCNGDEAYPAMLEAIDGAKNSIALASYIFADDEIGRNFVGRLVAAQARGVQVRVLLDGVGSGYFRAPIIDALQEGGVQAERFLHTWRPWRMTFINLRNHKKMLIVDGARGFAGGMNISGDNIGGTSAPKVQDVHAGFDGPVTKQLMLSFARDWEFTCGEVLDGSAWWPEEQFGTENNAASAQNNVPDVDNIAMRGIAAGPDESLGRIEVMLATAIEQATERVRIVTPYFLPENTLFEVVRRAGLRGVEVELVIPEKTNQFYFNWATAAHLASFPLHGITCFLTPAPFDHTKLMSVDGAWGTVGSANWDSRSMRLNFEFQVEIYGREAVAEIDAIIDRKIAISKVLKTEMLAERSTPIKLRDASARLFLPYF